MWFCHTAVGLGARGFNAVSEVFRMFGLCIVGSWNCGTGFAFAFAKFGLNWLCCSGAGSSQTRSFVIAVWCRSCWTFIVLKVLCLHGFRSFASWLYKHGTVFLGAKLCKTRLSCIWFCPWLRLAPQHCCNHMQGQSRLHQRLACKDMTWWFWCLTFCISIFFLFLQSFAHLGSSLSVLDPNHLGSFLPVRSFVRLGLSLLAEGTLQLPSTLLTFDGVHVDSPSFLQSCTCFELLASVLDFLHLGSVLPLHSFAHLELPMFVLKCTSLELMLPIKKLRAAWFPLLINWTCKTRLFAICVWLRRYWPFSVHSEFLKACLGYVYPKLCRNGLEPFFEIFSMYGTCHSDTWTGLPKQHSFG